MELLLGMFAGLAAWLVVRLLVMGMYTVDQNERAVKTIFGRAERIAGEPTTDSDPVSEFLRPDEKARYNYPKVRVIPPGGPYFKMPWERIHKVSVATMTVNMALDLEDATANEGGTRLEAVTRDQLNTGLTGQIRYRVSEANLYAFLFGIKRPFVHVMAYFVSVLRQRIANFESPHSDPNAIDSGVSINDLRKNLRDLNDYMDRECRTTPARYGVIFDASLITGIDPPSEVESALAAINTAHNQVSSDISLAQAAADQRVVQSKRAVEIETLKAEAEVQPIRSLAGELASLHGGGPHVLNAYLRNVRLALIDKAQQIYMEARSNG